MVILKLYSTIFEHYMCMKGDDGGITALYLTYMLRVHCVMSVLCTYDALYTMCYVMRSVFQLNGFLH